MQKTDADADAPTLEQPLPERRNFSPLSQTTLHQNGAGLILVIPFCSKRPGMLNWSPGTRGSFLNRLETTTPEVLCNWNEMGHNIGLAEIFLLTAQGWASGGVSGRGPLSCCPGAR